MNKIEHAYICDGHGCDRNCADTMTPEEWEKYPCHHTADVKFAKNKVARRRKWKFEGGKFYEI